MDGVSRRVIDLTGKVFGNLVVIKFVRLNNVKGAEWLCRCSCGKEKVIRATSLIHHRTSSCGHLIGGNGKLNLSGMKFERLTAIKEFGRDKNGGVKWLCQCDCGRTSVVTADRLRSGKTKSCGCYQRDAVTKHGLSYTQEYKRASFHRRRERERGLDGGWTPEMDRSLRSYYSTCVVCGGVDRLAVDHVKPLGMGYGLNPGNATILCTHCNSFKRDKPLSRLPVDMRTKIQESALAFKNHWEEISQHLRV